VLAKLVAFVTERIAELSHDPDDSDTYIIRWLALAESLQLDELRARGALTRCGAGRRHG
jgi:hypothetical protein